MSMPKPKMQLPPVPAPPKEIEILGDGELTLDEYSTILDSTLKSKVRNDEKLLRFMDSFIKCKDIKQASNEAGISGRKGYMYRHRLDVANALSKISDKSAVKYGFDKSEIFEKVKEAVVFDPMYMQNPDGTFKKYLIDVPPEIRRCIKSLKVKNMYNQVEDVNGIKSKIIVGEIIEYTFYDKLKAAELVGKEQDMFKNTTKHEHTLSGDMQAILLESAKLADERSNKDVIDITPDEVV